MSIKEFKYLEGKEVIVYPTGNNARRGKNEPEKVQIVKVAKVFITLRFEGRLYDEKYRVSDWKGDSSSLMNLHSEHNSGYTVYETMEKYLEYEEVRRLSELIIKKFKYCSDYQKVGSDVLRKVAELLGVE